MSQLVKSFTFRLSAADRAAIDEIASLWTPKLKTADVARLALERFLADYRAGRLMSTTLDFASAEGATGGTPERLQGGEVPPSTTAKKRKRA